MIRATLVLFLFWQLSTGRCYEECPKPPYNNRIAEKIVNSMEEFRSLMRTGIPELRIPVLDPLGPIPSINLEINNSMLNIKGSLNETLLLHLSDYVICEVTIKILRIKPHFTIEFLFDQLHFEGIYAIKGFFAFIVPVYGKGNYTLDISGANVEGNGKVFYNILTRHAQLHGLEINMHFDKVKLDMGCILGCNVVSDVINSFLDEMGTAIFNVFWNLFGPTLTGVLENAINAILKNVVIPLNGNISPSTNDTKMFGESKSGKLNSLLSLNEILEEKTTQNIN